MTDTIDKLTDDAIAKRLRAIQRMRATCMSHMAEEEAKVTELDDEAASLITAQIERLKAKLPNGNKADNV